MTSIRRTSCTSLSIFLYHSRLLHIYIYMHSYHVITTHTHRLGIQISTHVRHSRIVILRCIIYVLIHRRFWYARFCTWRYAGTFVHNIWSFVHGIPNCWFFVKSLYIHVFFSPKSKTIWSRPTRVSHENALISTYLLSLQLICRSYFTVAVVFQNVYDRSA